MNKESESARRLVHEAYEKLSLKIEGEGYRFNIGYVLNKAMVDWRLMHGLDLKNMEVLNVGCSEPIDEIFFASHVKAWTAVDFSPSSIAAARNVLEKELNPQLYKKISLAVADATQLPFSDETFDLVVSFSTLEHIPLAADRLQAFSEAARVAKKFVIITMPNKHSIFYFTHRQLMKNGKSDYGYAYLYTMSELKSDLIKSGLQPLRFTSEYEIPNLPLSLVRLFRPIRRFGTRIGFLCKK
ncbi:MAG: class I SAM-dependent methyltransferase [bacterium]